MRTTMIVIAIMLSGCVCVSLPNPVSDRPVINRYSALENFQDHVAVESIAARVVAKDLNLLCDEQEMLIEIKIAGRLISPETGTAAQGLCINKVHVSDRLRKHDDYGYWYLDVFVAPIAGPVENKSGMTEASRFDLTLQEKIGIYQRTNNTVVVRSYNGHSVELSGINTIK